MDALRPAEALIGASHDATKQKTQLVHPFNKKPKTYLLELPKDLKRKTPLLEIPKDFRKKPKPFEIKDKPVSVVTGKSIEKTGINIDDTDKVEMRTTSIQTETSCQRQKCHSCCCKGEEVDCQAVKVIFAPAMMPSIFGTVPGIPYIVKPNVKVLEKVRLK